MAIIASSSSSLQFSAPVSSSPNKQLHLHYQKSKSLFPISTRAVDPETNASETSETAEPAKSDNTDDFENRLSQVRLRYRSGQGKKAEVRKGKKGKRGSSSGGGVFLPPVALKEPVSEGLKVEFGFTPYTERLNGRLAALGLAALLLVELASGKSLINYHTPAIIFIQIYSVAAISAIFVKYQKEKISVWPQSNQR